MNYEIIPLEKFVDSALSSSTGAHWECYCIDEWDRQSSKYRTLERRTKWV